MRLSVIPVLGVPGSGKGTLSAAVARELCVRHISVGDLLREAIRDQTPTGSAAERFVRAGHLVPNEIMFGLVRDLVHDSAHEEAQVLLLDGFPREREQAVGLDAICHEMQTVVPFALYLELGLEQAASRLAGRRVCAADTHTFNAVETSHRVADRCPIDGSRLMRRADDAIETVRERLTVQASALKEVLRYYGGATRLRRIDASAPRDQVAASACGHVRPLAIPVPTSDPCGRPESNLPGFDGSQSS